MARSSWLRFWLRFVLGLIVVSMLSHYVVDAARVECQINTSAICIPAEDNVGSAIASENTTALHSGFLPPRVITTVVSPTPISLLLAPVARSSLFSLTPPSLPPR